MGAVDVGQFLGGVVMPVCAKSAVKCVAIFLKPASSKFQLATIHKKRVYVTSRVRGYAYELWLNASEYSRLSVFG